MNTYHSDSNRKQPFVKSKKQKVFHHQCAFEHDQKFQFRKLESKRAMKKLFFVALMCFFFMICEIAGGILSGSLAILTDAAHMFSDVTGFLISFAAVYISQRRSTMGRSMGNYRAEILGAVIAILLIWGLLVWVDIEAYHRIVNPPGDIDAKMMLIIACIGLFFNLLNFFALEADCGKKEDEEAESDYDLDRITELGNSMQMDNEKNDIDITSTEHPSPLVVKKPPLDSNKLRIEKNDLEA